MAVTVSAVQALQSGAILLDIREKNLYLERHAPGAVHVPVKSWDAAAKDDTIGFHDTAFWEERIGELGIDGSVAVATYDDGKQIEAARVWFILQLFGVQAFIVDGAWPALAAELKHAVSAGEVVPERRHFKSSRRWTSVDLVSRDTLRQDIEQDRVRVFDARTTAEYDGSDLRGNHRGGHLPNSINISHASLLDDGGYFKSPEELRTLLSDAGFVGGQAIVTHCQAGGRAALAAAAAVQAGFTNVATYYLSFGDWVKDNACPIDR